jgi:hypothetical protein
VYLLGHRYVLTRECAAETGRNNDYLDHAVRHAVDVAKAALTLRLLPEFLKPYSSRYSLHLSLAKLFFRDLRRGSQNAYKHLAPIIEERKKMQRELGSDWKKPV